MICKSITVCQGQIFSKIFNQVTFVNLYLNFRHFVFPLVYFLMTIFLWLSQKSALKKTVQKSVTSFKMASERIFLGFYAIFK